MIPESAKPKPIEQMGEDFVNAMKDLGVDSIVILSIENKISCAFNLQGGAMHGLGLLELSKDFMKQEIMKRQR